MESKVAYICNGLNPNCSAKIGCFKCAIGNHNRDDLCYHTLNPDYSVYGSCQYPGVWAGIRFKAVPSDKSINYFEEWDKNVIQDLIESGNIYLLPNEPFRDLMIDAYINKKLIFSEGENNND